MNTNIIDEPAYRNRVAVFKDRIQAGELLANKLRQISLNDSVSLLALPAGGVPVGYSISQALNFPLDVAVVRKIVLPWNSEAGYGAVSWTGRLMLNEPIIRQLSLSDDVVEAGIEQTRRNVDQRLLKFRKDRPKPNVVGKSVVLVDDGLASGFTMLVAVESVRDQGAERIIVAVPTGSKNAVNLVGMRAETLICLNVREGPFFAVADAYENWYDLSDDEVVELLGKSHRKSWT